MPTMASGSHSESDEREFLGSFVKDQKKYGSTASHKTERYMTHYVQPLDTLQGLALRYGVSMEHIKRANKLWTADSLFLRPTLNIPLLGEANQIDFKTPPYSSSSSQDSSPKRKNSSRGTTSQQSSVVDCQEEVCLDSSESSSRSQNGASSENGSASAIGIAATAATSQKEESVLDFLMRIDSSISKTKDQVMQRETKLNTKYSENDLFRLSNGRPSSSLAQRHSLSSLNPSDSGSRTSLHSNGHTNGGDHSPIVITKGRKVKYSLKRLERKQDELFEL